ncbi:MAG: efflux RND transporter permease subunit [Rhodobacteraceae bacterium]|nr:efflux RND transporter permease subunit [Paracoccaceae bacterium]
MTGIVAWAASRARMVIAFIILSIAVGTAAYVGLPKEGEPDIEIPALFVSVQFPGISAIDSESLLVKPMETELADLDGLKEISGTAAEGYAGVALEFEFGWDKTAIMADVRDAMNKAQADFPSGAEQYSITEINFSEFPIVIVNLTGNVPERTMTRIAKDLQDDLEALDAVLEAGLAGNRDEMVEVIIDPLRLESYNVTATELISVVQNNNQLIAAGEVETAQGTFAVKIPSSFDSAEDIYRLPVKTNGDRVITLGDLAEINFTFEDREGTARFNGENTVALQVVKRKGYNVIDTVQLIKDTVAKSQTAWPPELQAAVTMGTSNDQSRQVDSMVRQLEGSVLTAIALVMIVVLSALGSRAAMLVGFAIPTSFLLCFVLLAIMGVSISNIVMFGLILAVGMLVDGAIVVVEYADKRIKEGSGPMHAYVEAAQRMFWPIISSTATTLCAFLPMLFWPGVPGEFMGMLPVTLIFVLSASLIVALIFLPVMGGVSGRLSRFFDRSAQGLRARLPYLLRVTLVPLSWFIMFSGAMQVINPAYLMSADAGLVGSAVGGVMFTLGAFAASITMSSAKIERRRTKVRVSNGYTPFGHVIRFIAGNPIMPIVSIGVVFAGVMVTFITFQSNNYGVEFFVEGEPEQATAYVRARGNISLAEKDDMVRTVEDIISAHPAVINVFSFAGDGGLNTDASGAQLPGDTIGQVQFELIPWEDRPDAYVPLFEGRFGERINPVLQAVFGTVPQKAVTAADFAGDTVLDLLQAELDQVPGFETELRALATGPASAKPVHLRIKTNNWDSLTTATQQARAVFDQTPGLILIEDTLPLPGIDWQIDVDVEQAGRYGADVATVGAMVQLVTRGILLDTMRVDTSDEEIDIRVRLPEENRVLSTLDTLKVRTPDGLVPLANFITRQPVDKLATIRRVGQTRYYDVKADVAPGLSRLDDVEGTVLAYLRTPVDGVEPQGQTVTRGDTVYEVASLEAAPSVDEVQTALDGDGVTVLVNPTERIEQLTQWLETQPFTPDVEWEWSGDQEDQAESGEFLSRAFAGALFLMFIILLTQFNSFYNSILVLLAVVLSTTGVLIGMMVLQQPFSIIMTGTGIVALAGIVVNNNIVLIDTYQEYSGYMPRIEAIVRTAEARIRPVLLTTITTMAGLAPMMLGVSLDFIGGGYSIDSPTALMWKQLATAVVFGLGIATVLTLILTPSMLALRVWFWHYVLGAVRLFGVLLGGRDTQAARDWVLNRMARKVQHPEIIWDLDGSPLAPDTASAAPVTTPDTDDLAPEVEAPPQGPLRAAE